MERIWILGFSLLGTYFLINFVQCEDPAYEKAVYNTAAIMINSMKPPTVAGTLWCGRDTNAKSYNQVGQAAETDRCCRSWHNCEEFIPPNGEKFGFHNDANYRVLNCRCNEEFRGCLKNVTGIETPTAMQIGIAYFEVINPKCLKRMYYEPSCKVSYYDDAGNMHDENPNKDFFCPMLLPTVPW